MESKKPRKGPHTHRDITYSKLLPPRDNRRECEWILCNTEVEKDLLDNIPRYYKTIIC